MLNILCEEKIPFARDAFEGFGYVTLCKGNRLTSRDLKNVDVLMIRSGTRVDASLLEGTPVQFVGTATAGTDHVDVEYLKKRGIPFYNAPGCNAESVAEYVIAGLFFLAHSLGEPLQGKTIGVVGAGHVGGRLVERLPAFGLNVLVNDPPLQERDPARVEGWAMVSLEEMLKRADILTLHVPLVRGGVHPTHHLLGEPELKALPRQAWLINASRGGVVDNDALLRVCESGWRGPTLLDVWENEPVVDAALFRHVQIGTSHIAGHSYEGKVNGTIQIYEAYARHYRVDGGWDAGRILDPGPEDRLRHTLPAGGLLSISDWQGLIRQLYDIKSDDDHFRKAIAMAPDERGEFFLDCRKLYPRRRSFTMHELIVDEPPSPEIRTALERGLKLTLIPAP